MHPAEVLLRVTVILFRCGDFHGLARPFRSKAHSGRLAAQSISYSDCMLMRVSKLNMPIVTALSLLCAEYLLLWCGFFSILFLGLEGGIAAGVVLSALYFATAYARVRVAYGCSSQWMVMHV